MTIIIFLIILLALVLVHEFGHFIVAKRSGIWVEEFAFGFPPRLFSKKKGETTYSFNALPLGGYVKLHGEDGLNISIPERSFSFAKKSVQAKVLFAGVACNFIFAFILFTLSFSFGIPSSVTDANTSVDSHLTVTSILPNSPAEMSGVLPGDRIISVSSLDNRITAASPVSVQQFILHHQDQKLKFVFNRDGKDIPLFITPVEISGQGKKVIGISMDLIGTVRLPFHKAIVQGVKMTYFTTIDTVRGLGGIISRAFSGGNALDGVTGPVGLVHAVGSASSLGFSYLLAFAGIISINLAVINLVPFPALDGGRLLFLGIEVITKRPLPKKFVNTANIIGFALLILLMIFITYHDLVK